MIKTFTLSVLLAASLSACTTRVDEHGVRTHTDDIRIERQGYYYDGYPYPAGRKCPPGHHMKGWC